MGPVAPPTTPMAGYLQLAQAARAAHARIRSAQELEARWKALGPEAQQEARAEWATLRTTLAAVRDRVAAGPKGFARGFRAGYRGEEVEPAPDTRPLVELVRELHGATEALRGKLDALRPPDDEGARADGPATLSPGGRLPPGGRRAPGDTTKPASDADG